MSGRAPLDALPPRSGYRRRGARIAARAGDAALDAGIRLLARRLDRLAGAMRPRTVAVLGVYGERGSGPMAAAVAELRRGRHSPRFLLGASGEASAALAAETRAERMRAGRLANLNRLAAGAAPADWFLLVDDDVVLPGRFLDRLLALAERLDLDLAQPALTLTSHTAFPFVRRRPALARRTSFVEIGPVLLIRAEAFAELSPFPEEGMGWGVDLHWAAVAARRGWRLGVIDAVPVRHDLRPPATDYDREAAAESARAFLSSREHIGWREARTLESWKRL